MAYLAVEHCCVTQRTPAISSKNVFHNTLIFWENDKHIVNMAFMRDGYLNIRLLLIDARFFHWTLSEQSRVNPLDFYFFLNVKSKPIHLAPSLRASHDQDIYDFIFCGCTSNICPSGNAGRVISDILVVRLRPFDGACKARFAVRGRTLKLFIARAIQSLHGSFDFRWGETSSRIFDLLSLIKNRISPSCAWAQSFLCATGVTHSSEKPSRLNTLRVAERNFTRDAL